MLIETPNDNPAPDQPTEVFVALRPPWPVAEDFHARATQLCASAGLMANQRPFFILHVTVLSIGGCLGRLPRKLLDEIDAALSMVRFPAIDVVLDEAGSFETRKDKAPFVLKGEELTDVSALRLAARDALRVKGLKIPARSSYAPHLTLAYARRRAPMIKVEPFSWRACEFHLIESWVGRTKHVELARWTLLDETQPRETQSVRSYAGG